MISEGAYRRVINFDRAKSYVNPELYRSGKKFTRGSRHTTVVYGANAAGRALAPLYIFDSKAKIDTNFRVKASWLTGLPLVTGRFGRKEKNIYKPFVAVRSWIISKQ